jgi:hypothetical protein
MPFRPTVSEVSQIGVETVEGTAPGSGANKRLLGIGFNLVEAAEFDEVQPMGMLVPSAVPIRQNWSTFDISDGSYPDYNSLIYLFSGLFGAPTTTTPSGGTTSRQHVWTPGITTIARKTFTIQKGTPGGTAEQATGCALNSMTLGFSRTAAQTLSGDGYGRQLDYSATLTSSPTDVPVVPILASQIDVFLDNTGSGIGVSKLTGDFNAEWNVGGFTAPAWTLNSALPSYAESVLQRPDMGVSIELANDATSRALVTDMRAGTTKFLEIRCTGAIIEGSINYSLKIQAAFQINSPPSAGDIDGVSTLPFGGRVVYDGTWAKYLNITLVNTLTAL